MRFVSRLARAPSDSACGAFCLTEIYFDYHIPTNVERNFALALRSCSRASELGALSPRLKCRKSTGSSVRVGLKISLAHRSFLRAPSPLTKRANSITSRKVVVAKPVLPPSQRFPAKTTARKNSPELECSSLLLALKPSGAGRCEDMEVETPLAFFFFFFLFFFLIGARLAQDVSLVPISRWLGCPKQFSNSCRKPGVGHIGLYRERKHAPGQYYSRFLE